ncbi:MAG: hypothetical protein V1799_07505 [bacterium]
MDRIEVKVYRDRFGPKEILVGDVVIENGEYNFTGIDAGELENVKSLFLTPITFAVGNNPKNGYGEHSVQEAELMPATEEHLLAISNYRLESGLFVEIEAADLLP